MSIVLDGLAFVKRHNGSADETSAHFRKAIVWSGMLCVGLAVFFAIGYAAITLGDIWLLRFYARLSGLAALLSVGGLLRQLDSLCFF